MQFRININFFMKKIYTSFLLLLTVTFLHGQTPLLQAVDFTAKTIEGETINLFDLLEEDMIVVIDFFSTSCGPCGQYAPEIQASHEDFGQNAGNVFFMGISWGDSNEGVAYYDSIHGITYPSVSGFEGGGNGIVLLYEVQSYPTVIVITPDGNIYNHYIWEPTNENINDEVMAAGGVITDIAENQKAGKISSLYIFPNPFKEQAKLKINISESGEYNLIIYDLMGNLIGDLDKNNFAKGIHTLDVSLKHLASGSYILGLTKQKSLVDYTRITKL